MKTMILELFESHYEELYCHIRRFSPPRESEDLCQQAFLELCNRSDFENFPLGRDSLFSTAETLLHRKYRPLQRIHSALRKQTHDRDEEHDLRNRISSTTRRLRKVSRELSELPSDIRQSVRLVVAERNSLQEAAERMGVTSGLVESWTMTGLEMLTKRMCNYDNNA
ncbi:MAG: hypothetical protein CMJ24_12485 [Phycisphaerae bacterium]|mgnify:CR=1 FL=1|jgi:RNA polymerase sigma factor (sigma-70 family)|nr:hypothetical protein [Phycisphaerae bacterium]|tara:strand:+ start:3320 stop:3820 length:501 start_codon:yes stop_codon:yes gene_type:complete